MELPFDYAYQLYDMLSSDTNPDDEDQLPGQPRIRLGPDPRPLFEYLDKDLCTTDLDAMSPHLWLMATRSSANVSPLHHQIVKGRRIVITEDPRLHLLWVDDQVFIKPLPMYLLSYNFWERYLLPDTSSIAGFNQKSLPAIYPEWNAQKKILVKSALGILRSYLFLIQYSSDFEVALACRLLPQNTTFESFCSFSFRFETIKNTEVAARYHYGELRLARLNFWCKIFLRRWHYETVHRQYGQYFARFYGPLLFTFGFFSVMLSALQVEMAVESTLAQQQQGGGGGQNPGQQEPQISSQLVWPQFWTFSRVFSILSIVVVGLPSFGILVLLFGKPLMEFKYALTH